MLCELAKSLTTEIDVYLVGFQLRLKRSDIDRCFADHEKSINMTAYSMLSTWDETQGNRVEAYKNLRGALEKSNRQKDIETILEADE